jgi:hypothetical protein
MNSIQLLLDCFKGPCTTVSCSLMTEYSQITLLCSAYYQACIGTYGTMLKTVNIWSSALSYLSVAMNEARHQIRSSRLLCFRLYTVITAFLICVFSVVLLHHTQCTTSRGRHAVTMRLQQPLSPIPTAAVQGGGMMLQESCIYMGKVLVTADHFQLLQIPPGCHYISFHNSRAQLVAVGHAGPGCIMDMTRLLRALRRMARLQLTPSIIIPCFLSPDCICPMDDYKHLLGADHAMYEDAISCVPSSSSRTSTTSTITTTTTTSITPASAYPS